MNAKKQIIDFDNFITKQINSVKGNPKIRGFVSQSILGHLRTFTESIALIEYSKNLKKEMEPSHINITNACKYIKGRDDLSTINELHSLLQITTSHYFPSEENAERLMLKYCDYLIEIKEYVLNNYGMVILNNLKDFPLKLNDEFNDYYKEIVKILENDKRIKNSKYDDRYYIERIKPFIINERTYYEVTLRIARNNVSKFNRVIAFTTIKMLSNYAVQVAFSNNSITVCENTMEILVIDKWSVSIRACEFNNFFKILGLRKRIATGLKEYELLMDYITKTRINLAYLVEFSNADYRKIKEDVYSTALTHYIFIALNRCRRIIKADKSGCNVLRYLLFNLNNDVLK